MIKTDVIGSMSSSAEALADRIDTDRVAAAVSDVAIGELIAAAVPTVDVASAQIARTARVGWRWRRQLLIALAVGLTLGVALMVLRRSRFGRDVDGSEVE